MKVNKKILHISIIILGIVFILLSAFHENIWFDESYSVAIAKHDFVDIWNITGHDVHPALYYFMLHIVYLIFGNSVIAFRLFSVLAIAILGILGYTHIRKDFGEKTGILFSFLIYFMPVMNTYSQEIRMYSWSCLIVTLMCIYAYRFYKSVKENEKDINKNLILFGIFSIASCYLHYYALVTAGLVNLVLLIYLIRKVWKEKENKSDLIKFIILAVAQVILYIPWLIYLVGQINHVNSGFWIVVDSIKTPIEVLSFQFRRQLDTNLTFDFHTIISLIASIMMYIYIAFTVRKAKKEKQEIKPAILAGGVYIGVIFIMLILSLKQPILFSRYLMVMTGLYMFTLAFMIEKENKKWIITIICTIILALGIYSNVTNILINYDKNNMKQIEYIRENIKEDDILVYSNIGNGGVIAAFFPENKQYFYNIEHWDIEEAYKAYGPGMETIYDYNDILKDYKGRIWLIDSENLELWNKFPKDKITVLKEAERFDTKYQNYIYNIILVEKGE